MVACSLERSHSLHLLARTQRHLLRRAPLQQLRQLAGAASLSLAPRGFRHAPRHLLLRVPPQLEAGGVVALQGGQGGHGGTQHRAELGEGELASARLEYVVVEALPLRRRSLARRCDET